MYRAAPLLLVVCAALWQTAAAAEADPCTEPPDVDAQMACYVARYCDDTSTHRARADCYQTVIRNLLSEHSPPAPTVKPQPQQSAQPAPETNARVAGIALRAYGLRLFALDNAEVCEEIASSRARISAGDAVRIVRGSLNSYRMFPENGGLLRVRRLPCQQTKDDDVLVKCRAAIASARTESASTSARSNAD
jgi:hypothetical protein